MIQHLRTSFGPVAYSKASICRWAWLFRLGRTSIRSSKSTGRPTKLTPAKLQQLREMVERDRTVATRELARQASLAPSTIHHTLWKHMGLKKCPAKWVAHLLMPNQQAQRLAICRENLRLARRCPAMLRTIVSGDESWFFCYDPSSCCSTCSWLGVNEVRPQKVCRERSMVKVMLIIF